MQKVFISLDAATPEIQGAVHYVASRIDKDTRTALARVVLENPSHALRPGLFITARLVTDNVKADIVVEKDSLQYFEEEPFLFTHTDKGFVLRPVTLGRVNDTHVEITSGLKTGEKYVSKNGFRLKAEIKKLTSGVLGHGHVH